MSLQGKKIAVLATNEYHETELYVPYYRALEEGAEVVLVGINGEEAVKGKSGSYELKPELDIKDANPNDFDGVIIPGGGGPKYLRKSEEVLNFVRGLNEQGKLVAAICHAGWVLADAGVVQGKKVTAYPGIADDLVAAGADFVDEPLVVTGNLITSRIPKDLPQFSKAIVAFFE
ncbi:MAG: type 1 glutamine amidotransferase domain-containing protein [Tumebacillaceae bacterium]